MVTCLTCANLNLQDHPKHSIVGFGRCALEPLPGIFESIVKQRECGKYIEAPQEVIDARQTWENKRKDLYSPEGLRALLESLKTKGSTGSTVEASVSSLNNLKEQ